MEQCKLCGNEVDSLHHEAEQIVLKMIQRMNPSWVESDGGCQKCIEHYESLDTAVEVVEDDPPASTAPPA